MSPRKEGVRPASDVGYPRGPCKEHYAIDQFIFSPFMMIGNLKGLCDRNGIQLTITMKPTSIRFQFLRVLPDGTVNNKSYLFMNKDMGELNELKYRMMLMEINAML